MPAWKVLAVVAFGSTCFALALATLVVPLAMADSDYRWAWCGGLLLATALMGSLFALFLWNEDRRQPAARR